MTKLDKWLESENKFITRIYNDNRDVNPSYRQAIKIIEEMKKTLEYTQQFDSGTGDDIEIAVSGTLNIDPETL